MRAGSTKSNVHMRKVDEYLIACPKICIIVARVKSPFTILLFFFEGRCVLGVIIRTSTCARLMNITSHARLQILQVGVYILGIMRETYMRARWAAP